MDDAEQLAASRRAYIIAPAGCGKTYLIAKAVTHHAPGRELILTHTHAGVDVLRTKLRTMHASSSSYDISTIASWALRYALAFPKTSGQQSDQPNTDDEWKCAYAACARLLRMKPIQEIIRASYSGVYVDEYQDCSLDQHDFICFLSEILPCRILGDPLQGIFTFRNTTLVDWNQHIEPRFNRLPDLSEPWRWKNTSPALGRWLLKIRADLENGRPIDLNLAPSPEVTWIRLPPDPRQHHLTRLNALRAIAKVDGTVIAIMKWEAECNKIVNNLPHLFGNIETVACDALMDAAVEIETKTGVERMDAVVDFASKCLTGVNAKLVTVLRVLRKNGLHSVRRYTRQREMDHLQSVITTQALDSVLPTLNCLKGMPNTRVWRRELFYEMCRSLREFSTGQYPDLRSAAWAVRNTTRHVGRRVSKRVISRTLLVKGLECDHCVVLQAESLSVRDLYVALTRGSKSLTILSGSCLLQPQP